ncbi:MAG: arginine repressor [Paludibacter sp.]|nr:arginine repressor [Paludibacter sp.]
MKKKLNRFQAITDIIRSKVISNQMELNNLLNEQGFDVTQATLSRDLKRMKIYKTPITNGAYKYTLPQSSKMPAQTESGKPVFASDAILSLDFSGALAVVKTKTGYAGAIAYSIDNNAADSILGTIAGDDTILVIPHEGVAREAIQDIVYQIF